MRKSWIDLLDDYLGAALWDATKGVGGLLWRLVVLAVAALGGGALLNAGKEALGYAALGACLLLLLQVAAGFVVSRQRERRRQTNGVRLSQVTPAPSIPSEPAPVLALPPPAPEPTVPVPSNAGRFADQPTSATNESMERLREFYPSCRAATAYACEYLIADICDAGVGSKDAAKRLIVRLLRQYVILTYQEALAAVEHLMAAPGARSSSQLEKTVTAFENLACRYLPVLDWIKEVGPLFMEREKFLSSYGYRQLYQRHAKYVEFQRIVAARTDIGRVSVALAASENFLPAPLKSSQGESPEAKS